MHAFYCNFSQYNLTDIITDRSSVAALHIALRHGEYASKLQSIYIGCTYAIIPMLWHLRRAANFTNNCTTVKCWLMIECIDTWYGRNYLISYSLRVTTETSDEECWNVFSLVRSHRLIISFHSRPSSVVWRFIIVLTCSFPTRPCTV